MARSRRHLGPIPGTASLDPGASFYALPALVSPFLTFIACLRLFGDDRSAWQLIGWLGVGGGIVAGYGLIQFLVFPDSGLLYADLARAGALTATLVNRNNTATLLGVAALLLFASLFRDTGRLRTVRPAEGFDAIQFVVRQPTVMAWLALLLITLTALLLTMSRAGVASTIAGFLVMVALLGAFSVPRGGQRATTVVGGRLTYVTIGIASVLLVAAVFAGRVWLRIAAGGLDDAQFCILPGVLDAIRDNGIFGTGLATFQQIFQAYRDPGCGLGFVWDHAHDLYLEGMATLGIPFAAGCLFRPLPSLRELDERPAPPPTLARGTGGRRRRDRSRCAPQRLRFLSADPGRGDLRRCRPRRMCGDFRTPGQ